MLFVWKRVKQTILQVIIKTYNYKYEFYKSKEKKKLSMSETLIYVIFK